MKRLLIASLTLGLAACGTPQENCIASATREVRVVDGLIDEAQANLARGYALENVTVYRTQWVDCSPPPPPPAADGSVAPPQPPRMCLEDVPETVTRPKAIDLDEEARKLSQLQSKRIQLARQADAVIAQCRLDFPEE